MNCFRFGFATVIGSLLFSSTAMAVPTTVIKIGLGETGPDVAMIAGVFGTTDDGVAGTTGLQNTDIDFTGFLSGMPDILNGASFTLSNVLASGPATLVGPVVSQNTTGGTFELYDNSNNLLLSGVLGLGAISGSTVSSAGAIFNVTTTTYTGGSLLPAVVSSPAGLSFSFTAITTNGLPGLLPGQNGYLSDFVADATGNLDAESVPEPMTLGLLGLGLAGAAVRRRRA